MGYFNEDVVKRFRADAPPLLAGHYAFVPNPERPDQIYLSLWNTKVGCTGAEQFAVDLAPDEAVRANLIARNLMASGELWGAGLAVKMALGNLDKIQRETRLRQSVSPLLYQNEDLYVAAIAAARSPRAKSPLSVERLRRAWRDVWDASRGLAQLENLVLP